MRSTLPSLRDLLAEGGFRLRTATRADCARCQGRSRGTVSYNSEVAHCFRCGWSANRFRLARELGLARPWRRLQPVGFSCGGERSPANEPPQAEDSATRVSSLHSPASGTRRELRRRAQNEKEIRAFTRWREARLRQVSACYWGLSRAALRAGRALASGALTPAEQELAWDALARFYHAEADLNAAFDLLMCSKASHWLNDDARIEDLFVCWKEINA
jgi:hypothetical protein